MTVNADRASYLAMVKFATNGDLTPAEWRALSRLTLVDKTWLHFGPENVRWARSDAEEAANLAFYQSMPRRLR